MIACSVHTYGVHVAARSAPRSRSRIARSLDGGTPSLLGVRLKLVRSPSMFVLLAVTPGILGAQTVVPVHEEPRHRLAYEGPELRVLDIEILPGDTTLFHRHDAPIAYVFISPTPVNSQVLGQSWGSATRDTAPLAGVGNVIFDEGYATAPVEHRVTCLGDVPFRLIAVLNRGPGQATSGEESLGAVGPTEAEGRWFRSTHQTLANQATWEWEGHTRPIVVVQASSGSVSVELGTGSIQPGARTHLRNAGVGPVALAIIEVR